MALVAYDNTPTVVVVLVPISDGLLMIRRALADGRGKLALPGGYQMRGQTWQEAGARECWRRLGSVLILPICVFNPSRPHRIDSKI